MQIPTPLSCAHVSSPPALVRGDAGAHVRVKSWEFLLECVCAHVHSRMRECADEDVMAGAPSAEGSLDSGLDDATKQKIREMRASIDKQVAPAARMGALECV